MKTDVLPRQSHPDLCLKTVLHSQSNILSLIKLAVFCRILIYVHCNNGILKNVSNAAFFLSAG